MKDYQAYTRSVGVAIAAIIIYLFIDLVLFGCLVDAYPNMRERYTLLILTGLPLITYYLARLTSTGKLSLEIRDDAVIMNWQRQILFRSAPERVIRFKDIRQYKCFKHKLRGGIIRLDLNDGTRLHFSEQLIPFIRVNDFVALENDLVSAYESGISGSKTANTTLAELTDNMKHASTRKGAMFYFSIGIVLLFYFGLFGTIILFVFIDDRNYSELAICIVFYGVGSYSLYQYFKNAPSVSADMEKITFGNKEVYSWNDLQEVQLIGKQPFRYFINFPMEGVMLRFKNGTVKYLYDSMYSNLWQIKTLVKYITEGQGETTQLAGDGIAIEKPEEVKQNAIPKQTFISNDIRSEHFEYYKGNQFTSFRGIALWPAIIVGICVMAFNNFTADGWVLLSIAGVLWFLLFSYFMNYFGVSEHYLVIKNQNLLWKKKVYNLEDIEEVLLDSPQNRPYTLTVILKNFQEKFYSGSTLRDRHWYALKANLESKGIKVRDENYFTEKESKGIKKSKGWLYMYMVLYLLVTIVAYIFVADADVSDGTRIFLKILWLVLVLLLGIVGLRFVIFKLATMADKIDGTDKDGSTEAP